MPRGSDEASADECPAEDADGVAVAFVLGATGRSGLDHLAVVRCAIGRLVVVGPHRPGATMPSGHPLGPLWDQPPPARMGASGRMWTILDIVNA